MGGWGGGDRYDFSGNVASGGRRATPTLKVVRRVSCETYFLYVEQSVAGCV